MAAYEDKGLCPACQFLAYGESVGKENLSPFWHRTLEVLEGRENYMVYTPNGHYVAPLCSGGFDGYAVQFFMQAENTSALEMACRLRCLSLPGAETKILLTDVINPERIPSVVLRNDDGGRRYVAMDNSAVELYESNRFLAAVVSEESIHCYFYRKW